MTPSHGVYLNERKHPAASIIQKQKISLGGSSGPVQTQLCHPSKENRRFHSCHLQVKIQRRNPLISYSQGYLQGRNCFAFPLKKLFFYLIVLGPDTCFCLKESLFWWLDSVVDLLFGLKWGLWSKGHPSTLLLDLDPWTPVSSCSQLGCLSTQAKGAEVSVRLMTFLEPRSLSLPCGASGERNGSLGLAFTTQWQKIPRRLSSALPLTLSAGPSFCN